AQPRAAEAIAAGRRHSRGAVSLRPGRTGGRPDLFRLLTVGQRRSGFFGFGVVCLGVWCGVRGWFSPLAFVLPVLLQEGATADGGAEKTREKQKRWSKAPPHSTPNQNIPAVVLWEVCPSLPNGQEESSHVPPSRAAAAADPARIPGPRRRPRRGTVDRGQK